MHPDTRAAILAMLNGIESQLSAVRSLLGAAGEVPATMAGRPQTKPVQSRTYLTDEEDDALADDLGITEVERMAEKAHAAIPGQQAAVQGLMQQALAGMEPYSDEQRNAAFLRGTMGV